MRAQTKVSPHARRARMYPFVLASASPRRRQLLELLGLEFQVLAGSAEQNTANLPVAPRERVKRLAAGKAKEAAVLKPEALVVAADTMVAVGKQLLGKPRDEQEACAMLALLSGRWHEVYTGVALVLACEQRCVIDCEITRVRFRPLSAREIDAYVRTGEPMDKAGAYGIQGLGAVLVEQIEGCFFNVIGLPLTRLTMMLKNFGLEVLEVSNHARDGHQGPARGGKAP